MKARHYFILIVAYMMILFGSYSLVYFHYHDSPYAEACPEQKTLLWCEKVEINNLWEEL